MIVNIQKPSILGSYPVTPSFNKRKVATLFFINIAPGLIAQGQYFIARSASYFIRVAYFTCHINFSLNFIFCKHCYIK